MIMGGSTPLLLCLRRVRISTSVAPTTLLPQPHHQLKQQQRIASTLPSPSRTIPSDRSDACLSGHLLIPVSKKRPEQQSKPRSHGSRDGINTCTAISSSTISSSSSSGWWRTWSNFFRQRREREEKGSHSIYPKPYSAAAALAPAPAPAPAPALPTLERRSPNPGPRTYNSFARRSSYYGSTSRRQSDILRRRAEAGQIMYHAQGNDGPRFNHSSHLKYRHFHPHRHYDNENNSYRHHLHHQDNAVAMDSECDSQCSESLYNSSEISSLSTATYQLSGV
mmetsp:Transcript_691/g.987  ORF Transcript_691/g.987 Transcript_691/m.987 type:complete len:279 (-) Transcript_691:1016-1852(-)